MDIEQIKDLMNHLEASKLSKLIFKKGDFELHLEKEPANLPRPRALPVETEYLSEAPSKAERAPRVDAPGTFVTSPMVGTFYGSPAPDQPSFVKVGDKVTENTVVCIVEAMKVMNEVKAGMSGIVAEILADSSQPVEFGTRLLRIT
jgi:acetyl-CoA carboxylase biotin carboxyl carrier protein